MRDEDTAGGEMGIRVLRLCSVFEAPDRALSRARGYDAVGGMQVHTARLTQALAERGVRQTVVTAYRPGAPRTEERHDGTRVVRVGLATRAFRQLIGAGAVPAVARAASRVDLVHVHLGEDLAVPALGRWAARRARVPLVVTVHCSLRFTLEPHDVRSALLRTAGAPIERRAEAGADAIFVLTPRLVEPLRRSGISLGRVHLAPLGVDLRAFGRAHGRPSEMGYGRWILYVGRLVRPKGVRDLVSAFALQRAPDVGLLLVGEGPERSALEHLAIQLGVADRVRFAGAVPNASIPAILQHAELLVLPSWYEEFGRVLVEGMAADVPIVATDVGGIPWVIRHGENGLLVPPRDPRALAGAIDDVLDHPELAASLSAAGRATVARHDLAALAELTLGVYESVQRPDRAPPSAVHAGLRRLRA